VMVPSLTRSMLRATETTLSEFLREAVVPLLAPSVALVGATGLVVALRPPDVLTLVVGAVAGGVAFAVVAVRWSMHRAEFDELRALVRRPRAAS